jgi:lysozyme family protein
MRCDELPAGVDDCVFDYAVHSGTGRAPKVLQRCLGIAVSGKMDAATLAAARRADSTRLIDAICDERLRFLRSLKIWPVFGVGWSRRVAEVRAFAHTLAQGTTVAAAASRVPRMGAVGKAVTEVNARAQATSAGAVIAVGAAAAARADKPATLFVVVVATIAVAAGAWLFWRWWRRRKQEARA